MASSTRSCRTGSFTVSTSSPLWPRVFTKAIMPSGRSSGPENRCRMFSFLRRAGPLGLTSEFQECPC
eukprot:3734340-Heterocapsa_arctica.AAC.1